jgi:uncharacterized protein
MLKAIAQERTGAAGASAPVVQATAWSRRCPHRIHAPLMGQDWLGLSFLHWPYPPAAVGRLLPPELTVEMFDGAAWVSLVPFQLRVKIPRGPALPWIGVFPETNVRTYVRGPDGRSGIWFLSLDAPRRLAIWAARRTYHLPYRVAAMHMRCDARVRAYASLRLAGPGSGASSRVRVAVGDPIASADVTPRERFLVDRWRLYAPMQGGVGTAAVEHEPWVLRRADVEDVDARLLTAAGLPDPPPGPLAHACGDVHALLGRLTRCGSHRGGSGV